jgi:hypothetical protein
MGGVRANWVAVRSRLTEIPTTSQLSGSRRPRLSEMAARCQKWSGALAFV